MKLKSSYESVVNIIDLKKRRLPNRSMFFSTSYYSLTPPNLNQKKCETLICTSSSQQSQT